MANLMIEGAVIWAQSEGSWKASLHVAPEI